MMPESKISNWVIYKIISPSGRIYIGKTSNLENRKKYYQRGSAKNQILLNRSLNKYGFDKHTIEVLDEFIGNNDSSDCKEMFWIRSFMSNYSKYPEQRGLNLTDGGQGGVGRKWSEDKKRAKSEYMRANPIVRRVRKMTDEEKKKASDTMKKLIAIGAYTPPFKGKKHSKESIEKMSKASLGQTHNRGRKHSEETKEKNRQAALRRTNHPTGYKWSESDKIKHREIHSKRCGRPITQYSLSGDFIGEYPSLCEASRATNLAKSTINNILKRTKNPKSFVFKYKK